MLPKPALVSTQKVRYVMRNFRKERRPAEGSSRFTSLYFEHTLTYQHTAYQLCQISFAQHTVIRHLMRMLARGCQARFGSGRYVYDI